MKIRYIILPILILCSFYLTDRLAIILNNRDLIKAINLYSAKYNSEPVNATINNEYIVPGINGRKINTIKSLINMASFKEFNSYYLKDFKIKPEISLENNKDKIIMSGNTAKAAVSIIMQDDENAIMTYLITEKIPASLLVNKDTYNLNPYFEQINNDFKNYDILENKLNKDKKNTNICLIGRNNQDFCTKKKKYLVKPTFVLNEANIMQLKNKINSGDIILIKSNTNISDVNLLIKYIKNIGLEIIPLSTLIHE